MFARIVKFNLKPNRMAECTEILEKQVIPMMRKEKGFQDEIAFADPNGTEMIAISLWDRKDSAELYNGVTYPDVLKALLNVIEGTPQVKTYEVSNSTFGKIAERVAV